MKLNVCGIVRCLDVKPRLSPTAKLSREDDIERDIRRKALISYCAIAIAIDVGVGVLCLRLILTLQLTGNDVIGLFVYFTFLHARPYSILKRGYGKTL